MCVFTAAFSNLFGCCSKWEEHLCSKVRSVLLDFFFPKHILGAIIHYTPGRLDIMAMDVNGFFQVPAWHDTRDICGIWLPEDFQTYSLFPFKIVPGEPIPSVRRPKMAQVGPGNSDLVVMTLFYILKSLESANLSSLKICQAHMFLLFRSIFSM